MLDGDEANIAISVNVEHGVLIEITGFGHRRIAKFNKHCVCISEVANFHGAYLRSKKCVMYGLTVRQEHNTQEAISHLRHLHPALNSAISLDFFPNRRPDGLLDPRLANDRPVRTVAYRLKVARDFHAANVAEIRFAGSSCGITLKPRGDRSGTSAAANVGTHDGSS